ncbi:hypothetical protein EPUS_04953 [Endocarpon pusillum Z07020]|uniref:SnoaL-like domain-containing protein n=1 Tax=Endocarpon pusillum (strain Z07020 / HMAS-L-300199) TaxID=1263415 RepID=U1HNT1_ENDPU|nr:uncharacterized protein EPUS_04953 [Endocarpon pusillum Z07020]ERF72035.1 hypothetical protein EPUS_04953 [Endocarpon pusillum Z07020]
MRVSVHRFILLAFTAFCLVYLVDAAPPNPVSAVAAIEPRKPPPKAPPGCPTARYLHSLSKYFLRSFYDPDIKKQFGSYEGYTQDWFWDQFSITDTTPNYPAEQKGKKLAAPGRWAKSRREFSNILTEVIPKIRNVLGDIHLDENELSSGGMEGNDCLTGVWKATYIATLKKPYGGKKKGTKVRWTHYHTIKVGKLDPNIGFQILNATVRTDWSAFYK